MKAGSVIPGWLLRRSEISSMARIIYGVLSAYAGDDKQFESPWNSIELAQSVGIQKRQLSRCLKELETSKLIHIERGKRNQITGFEMLDHPWSESVMDDSVSRTTASAMTVSGMTPSDSRVSDMTPSDSPKPEKSRDDAQNREGVMDDTVSDMTPSAIEAKAVHAQDLKQTVEKKGEKSTSHAHAHEDDERANLLSLDPSTSTNRWLQAFMQNRPGGAGHALRNLSVEDMINFRQDITDFIDYVGESEAMRLLDLVFKTPPRPSTAKQALFYCKQEYEMAEEDKAQQPAGDKLTYAKRLEEFKRRGWEIPEGLRKLAEQERRDNA